MKTVNFIYACVLILILSSIMGCALWGVRDSGVNWALKEKGGKVTASSEDPGHPASTLNNAITSSEKWDEGEGWQISPGSSGRGERGFGAGSQGRRGSDSGQNRNWVIIELAQPVTVTHVKIHTIDSKKYPAKDFGVSHLVVQYESLSTLGEPLWINADRQGKGVGDRNNIIQGNVSGVIDVKIAPIKTKRIRVIIYGTNDMDSSEGSGGGRNFGRGRGRGRNVSGTIRLTEIEVYGV